MRQWIGLFMVLLFNNSLRAAEDIAPLCGGPDFFIGMVDRGGNANSPCTAYGGKLITEFGYTMQSLAHESASQQNYPSPMFRYGLGNKTEINYQPPSYISQTISPKSGFSASILGLKHEFYYTQDSIISVESLLTLPDGSSTFGSSELGGQVNLMYSATLNQALSITTIMGLGRYTQTRYEGRGHYEAIAPDIVLTWGYRRDINVFGEVYAQSKTAPDQGWGVVGDIGILYMPKQWLVLNVGVGQGISGQLTGLGQFVTAGISVHT